MERAIRKYDLRPTIAQSRVHTYNLLKLSIRPGRQGFPLMTKYPGCIQNKRYEFVGKG